MTPLDLAVAAAVAAGAVAQAVTGIGLVLVCGPLLVALAGPADGVRLAVVVSLALNLALLVRDHRLVRCGDAARLLVPAALVTPVVATVVRHADTRAAAAAAGAAVAVAALLLAFGRTAPWLASRPGTLLAGAASGAMNTLAAVAGPVAALYAANARWPARGATATLQAYFAGLNLVALVVLGPPAHAAQLLPVGLGLAVGTVAGVPLARRTPAAVARRLVLALAAVGGGVVLLRALSGMR